MSSATRQVGILPFLAHFGALQGRWPFIKNRAEADRRARFIDRLLGNLWFVVAPIAEILIYYILVAVIFRSRDFYGVPVFLGITGGLIHFWVFQRTVSSCISAFVNERSIMLQIKIEPLVFVVIKFLNEIRSSRMYLLILVAAMAAYGFVPSWHIIFYPLVLAFLIFSAWSFSVLAATAYVFFRDVQEIFNIVIRVILYSSPVIYALSFVPESIQPFFLLNPFAVMFSLVGSAVFGFPPPPALYVIWCLVFFIAVFIGAHCYYEASKRQFTKVM